MCNFLDLDAKTRDKKDVFENFLKAINLKQSIYDKKLKILFIELKKKMPR